MNVCGYCQEGRHEVCLFVFTDYLGDQPRRRPCECHHEVEEVAA